MNNTIKFFYVAAVAAAFGLSASPTATADPNEWTLEAATRRALEMAPEVRAADADVAARTGELRQANSWPNPTVEVRADNKMGQEDGRGGTDVTQLVLSQPLPIRRLEREREAAQARLSSAEETRRFRRLQIEREIADLFFAAQLAQARLDLVRERRRQTEIYPDASERRDPLKRYLSPFDRTRLSILREEASQAVASAEREHEKALTELRARLALPPLSHIELPAPALPVAPLTIDTLIRDIDNHPAIVAAQKTQQGAVAGIDAARSQRFADPALNLFRERDVLNDARRNITGVGISVQIPLWNSNAGPVDRAVAEAARAQTDLDVQRRDVMTRLQRSYVDLQRLRVQAQQVNDNLLEPARKLNELARRSFATGEVNVLALVDAFNIYYEARGRYLELLMQAQLADAELRLASGRSLVENRP